MRKEIKAGQLVRQEGREQPQTPTQSTNKFLRDWLVPLAYLGTSLYIGNKALEADKALDSGLAHYYLGLTVIAAGLGVYIGQRNITRYLNN
jgi:hypothetical protein